MPKLAQNPYFLWQPAACLRVTGEDALNFLQGQFANDLRKLMPDQAIYGLWLNQKGKVAADSFVLRVAEEEFRLVSYESPAAALVARLESFIIADDVTVTDETADWSGVTILSAVSVEETRSALGEGFVFAGRRGAEAAIEWIAPAARLHEMLPTLNLGAPLSAAEMEARRMAARIPAVPRDIGADDLPQEGGLERDAVSFTKGCYLGQEVMARLQAMGRVRRRLVPAQGSGAVPALPAALYAGEKKAGELRTAVNQAGGFTGLALINLMSMPADGRLALAPDGVASITVEVPHD
ncbi:MAG: folate-binding protein YgfZ [Cephaloticoccus sp.]|nr:folate-binding protein YgfZ [Cephaloticoccus sp.]